MVLGTTSKSWKQRRRLGWCEKLSSIQQYEKNGKRRPLFFITQSKKGYCWYSVVKKYHPDPTDKSKRFVVSVAAVKALKNKVNLSK